MVPTPYHGEFGVALHAVAGDVVGHPVGWDFAQLGGGQAAVGLVVGLKID
jgi:hypothetical protein